MPSVADKHPLAYSLPAVLRSVTQSTPRAVTLSSCLLLSLCSISIHSQHQCTNRLQLQVDGWGPQCHVYVNTPRLRREALAAAAAIKSAMHGPLSIAQLHTRSAVRCSRFPRESSRFHSQEIGNEKVQESRVPGKREPGNGNTTSGFLSY